MSNHCCKLRKHCVSRANITSLNKLPEWELGLSGRTPVAEPIQPEAYLVWGKAKLYGAAGALGGDWGELPEGEMQAIRVRGETRTGARFTFPQHQSSPHFASQPGRLCCSQPPLHMGQCFSRSPHRKELREFGDRLSQPSTAQPPREDCRC